MAVSVRQVLGAVAGAGLVLSTAVLVSGGVADAAAPVRPGQHFVGLVNGHRVDAEVKVACGGAVWPGRTGPVAGRQTLSIERVGRGGGFTGQGTQVSAWFQSSQTTASGDAVYPPSPVMSLTTYRTDLVIPADMQVPCGGTGEVQFSTCSYLARCVGGFIPDTVTVRFVNILR